MVKLRLPCLCVIDLFWKFGIYNSIQQNLSIVIINCIVLNYMEHSTLNALLTIELLPHNALVSSEVIEF